MRERKKGTDEQVPPAQATGTDSIESSDRCIAPGAENERVPPSAPNHGSVLKLALAEIAVGRTPRKAAIDESHVRVLLARLDDLPPVLVHWPSMALIDGAHRLRAAQLAGREHVFATLFEGTEAEAFAEGVRRNVAHGKPLTLAERESAAREILRSDPSLADRRVAEICGLSADTVSRLRVLSGSNPTSFRTGRDGKRRPTNPGASRAAVADFLVNHPESSDRAAATATGVSQGTVRDVRRRLTRGESPLPNRLRERQDQAQVTRPATWQADSACRSDSGALEFARWIDAQRIRPGDWQRWVKLVPLSRLYPAADEARLQAREWMSFADALEAQARRRGSS